MDIHNRTKLTIDQVSNLELIKTGQNRWRGRNIRLYQHPDQPDRVISDGITFDGSMRVICDESKADWARELNAPASFITE